MYETAESLNHAKSSLTQSYKSCKSQAKPIKKAFDAWQKAQVKADASPQKLKVQLKADELCDSFEAILKGGYAAYKNYKKCVEDINESYSRLIDLEGKRSQKRKLENACEKFKQEEEKKIASLDAIYGIYKDYAEPAGEQKNTEPKKEELAPKSEPSNQSFRQPVYTPPAYQYTPYQQPVNIAPVSIDISHIVENAVKNAMDKFSEAFNARANGFIASMPSADANTDAAVSGTVLGMAEKVADDERFVLDKLVSLLESLKEASDKLTELTASSQELLEKQKTASESARRVNDMQRSLSRELQGVQANQKIITQDQMSVTEEQHVVFEHQKAALERQGIISEAQKAMSDTQITVMENQKLLEKAMRELLNTQKSNVTSAKSLQDKVEKPKALDSEAIDVELDSESGKDKLSELQEDEKAL